MFMASCCADFFGSTGSEMYVQGVSMVDSTIPKVASVSVNGQESAWLGSSGLAARDQFGVCLIHPDG